MIQLRYDLMNASSGPSGPNPDLWVDECQLAAFEGFQVFIVNQMDFSGALPILGFARFLRIVVNKIKTRGESKATYRDLSSEWAIDFKWSGSVVTISDHRGSAAMDLDEFESAVSPYVDRVWQDCCSACPQIIENEFVVEWWNNAAYSVLNYEPKKTDKRTLTPFNKFIENQEESQ